MTAPVTCLCIGRSVDHAVDGLREQVRIEAGLQKVILRAALYRELRKILVLGGTENQDRNAWGCTMNSLERLDTLSIIQKQVDEYGVDSTLSLLPGKALERGRAGLNPLNDDAGVGRLSQRSRDRLRGRRIVV